MDDDNRMPEPLFGKPVVVGKLVDGSPQIEAIPWTHEHAAAVMGLASFRVRWTDAVGEQHVGKCYAKSPAAAVNGFINEVGAVSAEVISQDQGE